MENTIYAKYEPIVIGNELCDAGDYFVRALKALDYLTCSGDHPELESIFQYIQRDVFEAARIVEAHLARNTEEKETE